MKTLQKTFRQRGVTLIELMVGIAIGLLVIAVAMGALMVSRGVSGTVSDASGIQQQGAYIMRAIGQQLRQNGSLFLNPDPTGMGATEVLSPVVFEIKSDPISGNGFTQEDTLVGASDTITTGFRRYQDNVFIADNATATDIGTDYLARNCVGAPGNTSTDQKIESVFTFANNTLSCQGNGVATPQPIAQNVAQFEMTYMVQTTTAAGSTVQFRQGSVMPALATDPQWRQVQGVRVCVVLFGSEPIDMPAGSTYTDCGGNLVDMTDVATVGTQRRNRMHTLFTSTFQLRSQGLLSNAS